MGPKRREICLEFLKSLVTTSTNLPLEVVKISSSSNSSGVDKLLEIGLANKKDKAVQKEKETEQEKT